MKLFVSIFIISFSSLNILARELKIESFEFLGHKDLTAQTSPKYDLNGNTCAVIKVSAPDGIKFEGNVIASLYDVNEYIVYVSTGTKNITMKCPGYETLYVSISSSDFPAGLESGRTYRLKIGGFDNNGSDMDNQSIGANYVVFKINPTNGVSLKIDDRIKTVENGEVMSFLRYGQHSYLVEADGYAPQSGSINIKEGDTQTVNVMLVSILGSLKIDCATKGSSIFINGQRKGSDSWTGQLSSGLYNLEVTKDGYKPYKTTIELSQKENKKISIPSLDPIYGTLQVEYKPIGATILIDGKSVGITPKVISDIMVGEHVLTIKKEGYREYATKVDIREDATKKIIGKLLELKKTDTNTRLITKNENSTKSSSFKISGFVRNNKTGKPIPCVIKLSRDGKFLSTCLVNITGTFNFDNVLKFDKLEFFYNGKLKKELILVDNTPTLNVNIDL